MYKMTTAAALAALAALAMFSSAHAATPHPHRAPAHLAAAGTLEAYAQAPTVRDPAVQNRDWESRSLFYRGPTYIGRY
jgi:hypothetical protein